MTLVGVDDLMVSGGTIGTAKLVITKKIRQTHKQQNKIGQSIEVLDDDDGDDDTRRKSYLN